MKINVLASLVSLAAAFGVQDIKYGSNQTGVIGLLPGEGGFNAHLTVNGKLGSYWDDIPWKGANAEYINIVIEIPTGECAKLETATKVVGNPIQQDIKNGVPRFYAKGPMPFNYGMIPQTWESEYEDDPFTSRKGDKDPIDVVDLSDSILPVGIPLEAKVLGILGMVDDGETDWKVITVAVGDSNYDKWNDIGDIDAATLNAILVWHQTYKSTNCLKVNKDNTNEFVEAGDLDCGPNMYLKDRCVVSESKVEFEDFSGKSNAFPGNTKFMDKTGAMLVISHTHDSWLKLFTGGYAGQPGVEKY